MKLFDLPLLTDENIHSMVVSFLRGEGCDVLDVKESGLTGTVDEDLLHRSFSERRVILTHDRDFGRLAMAAGKQTFGLVYLRPGHIDPKFTIDTLRVLQSGPDLVSPFVLVARRVKNVVRMRLRSL